MLVLTKKVGETIILDFDIEITIKDIQGSHATIGIKAPKEVMVYHGEKYEGMSDYITPPYG